MGDPNASVVHDRPGPVLTVKAQLKCVERGGDLRTHGEIGRIKPRNAAVIARCRVFRCRWAGRLDLQVRQRVGIRTGINKCHRPDVGIIATWLGLDHQLESRSGAALEHGNAVRLDRYRRAHRAVGTGEADEGDLWADKSWVSASASGSVGSSSRGQLDDVGGIDDLIAVDVSRATVRISAGWIGEDERDEGLQIRAVDHPVAVDVPGSGRIGRSTEQRPRGQCRRSGSTQRTILLSAPDPCRKSASTMPRWVSYRQQYILTDSASGPPRT